MKRICCGTVKFTERNSMQHHSLLSWFYSCIARHERSLNDEYTCHVVDRNSSMTLPLLTNEETAYYLKKGNAEEAKISAVNIKDFRQEGHNK